MFIQEFSPGNVEFPGKKGKERGGEGRRRERPPGTPYPPGARSLEYRLNTRKHSAKTQLSQLKLSLLKKFLLHLSATWIKSNLWQNFWISFTDSQWRRDTRARQVKWPGWKASALAADLASALAVIFFLLKEIYVHRMRTHKNDAVSVNLPTAKMWNKSQVSINVIFFHHCLGKKDCN